MQKPCAVVSDIA